MENASTNTSTKALNIVQETTDYDRFVLMEANRDQSRGHVEAIKAAFEEIGNLTRVQPILVNERFEIIDGQHRFTVCKELGEPIYYTQVPGLGINDARKMNILHRNWTIADYARSYALAGDTNYQRYETLREEYGFNHSIILVYSMGYEQKGTFKRFRQGQYTLSSRQYTEAQERLNKLAGIADNFKLAETIPFALALLQASHVEGFDYARLLDKVGKYGTAMITRQAGVPQYMRLIEDLYNHNQPENSRLRLF